MKFAELFHRSFEENVLGNEEVFFSRFYQNFLDSSPLIHEIFRHIDLKRQIDMLEQSVLLLVDFSGHKCSNETLKKLTVVHARVGVTRDMYDLWMLAILKTVEQLDPNFSHAEGLAWRIMLAPGIEFMKYFQPYTDPI